MRSSRDVYVVRQSVLVGDEGGASALVGEDGVGSPANAEGGGGRSMGRGVCECVCVAGGISDLVGERLLEKDWNQFLCLARSSWCCS